MTGRDPGRDPIAKAAALERAVALEDDAVLAVVGQPLGSCRGGLYGIWLTAGTCPVASISSSSCLVL